MVYLKCKYKKQALGITGNISNDLTKIFKRALNPKLEERHPFIGRTFTDGKPLPEDIAAAQKGLKKVKSIMASEEYKVIILEEANVAAKFGLIRIQDLLGLIINKPYNLELVITGRYASSRVIESADLVTEMKPVKHYFEKGVPG